MITLSSNGAVALAWRAVKLHFTQIELRWFLLEMSRQHALPSCLSSPLSDKDLPGARAHPLLYRYHHASVLTPPKPLGRAQSPELSAPPGHVHPSNVQ